MDRNDPAPSVWLVAGGGRRINKGTLDRDVIAAAALEILDDAGLDALTMRSLGERLRVSAMACYAHVRHKDDVLELAQDAVMGALHVPVGPWDDTLRGLATDYRDLLVTHLWLPALAGRFLNAGPNTRALTRDAGRALVAGGLRADLVPLALSAAFSLAHGHGAIEAAWRAHLPGRDALDDLTSRLAALDADDPVLAHRAAGTATSQRAEWDFALDCLLEGIRARQEEP